MIPEEEKKKKKDRVQKEKRERKKEGGHFMSLNVERSLPSIKLTFKKKKNVWICSIDSSCVYL